MNRGVGSDCRGILLTNASNLLINLALSAHSKRRYFACGLSEVYFQNYCCVTVVLVLDDILTDFNFLFCLFQLPCGVELTLGELRAMALRQQQQIDCQHQLLAAREQRLRFLKQQEARHHQVSHSASLRAGAASYGG